MILSARLSFSSLFLHLSSFISLKSLKIKINLGSSKDSLSEIWWNRGLVYKYNASLNFWNCLLSDAFLIKVLLCSLELTASHPKSTDCWFLVSSYVHKDLLIREIADNSLFCIWLVNAINFLNKLTSVLNGLKVKLMPKKFILLTLCDIVESLLSNWFLGRSLVLNHRHYKLEVLLLTFAWIFDFC